MWQDKFHQAPFPPGAFDFAIDEGSSRGFSAKTNVHRFVQ